MIKKTAYFFKISRLSYSLSNVNRAFAGDVDGKYIEILANSGLYFKNKLYAFLPFK
jgi:hypothetical protein